MRAVALLEVLARRRRGWRRPSRGRRRGRRSSSCPRGRRAGPGWRPRRSARPRRSCRAATGPTGSRPASDSLVSLRVPLVDEELADEALAAVDLLQDGVQGVQGVVEAVAEVLALLALRRDRAEKPLALLGAAEDRLQGLGDRPEIGQEVAAALEELLEPGSGGGRDLTADRDLGLGAAGRPASSMYLSPSSPRVLIEARVPFRSIGAHRRDDVVDRRCTVRSAGSPERLTSRTLPTTTPLSDHDVAGDEPGGRLEVRLVGELLAEEVRPLADHEDPDHRRDERDDDHEADAESPADLLFSCHVLCSSRCVDGREDAGAAREAHGAEVLHEHGVAAAGGLVEGSDELEPALVQEGQPVGDRSGGDDVVGDDDRGRLQPDVDVDDELGDLLRASAGRGRSSARRRG